MSATLTPPASLPVPTLESQLYRFSVAQCEAMLAAGVFGDSTRVELLDGLLLVKDMENTPHIVFNDLLRAALGAVVPVGWYARWDHPIRLATSLPEPDGAIVRGTIRDYIGRLPTSADIGLVVEVADSSLLRDRREKMAIYAAERLAVYWILDIAGRQLEVRTGPRGTGATADYAHLQILGPGDRVPLVLDGTTFGTVAVADLLP